MVEIPLNLQEDEISVEWNTEKLIWVIGPTDNTHRWMFTKCQVSPEAASGTISRRSQGNICKFNLTLHTEMRIEHSD